MVRAFGLVLVSLLTMSSFSWAGDWEYWSGYVVKVPLGNRVVLNIKPQFRFKEDMSTYFYHKIYIGPTVKINEHFDVALYYAYKTAKSRGVWKDESIPTLDAIPKWKLWRLKFSDRNRIEYSSGGEVWKYRNCFKVKKPIKLGNNKITLFISDEVFYNFDSSKLDENRVSVGSSVKFTDNLGLSVSCLLKSKKNNNEWKDTNILITALKLDF